MLGCAAKGGHAPDWKHCAPPPHRHPRLPLPLPLPPGPGPGGRPMQLPNALSCNSQRSLPHRLKTTATFCASMATCAANCLLACAGRAALPQASGPGAVCEKGVPSGAVSPCLAPACSFSHRLCAPLLQAASTSAQSRASWPASWHAWRCRQPARGPQPKWVYSQWEPARFIKVGSPCPKLGSLASPPTPALSACTCPHPSSSHTAPFPAGQAAAAHLRVC